MPAAKKVLTKEQILSGMRYTRSIKSLAKYLGCSYQHLKAFMKIYVDEDTNKTLFEVHKNQQGIGIPKLLKNGRKEPNVGIIFKTGSGWESFSIDKIKEKGIREGYLHEHCYMCDFADRRSTDYKVPLLLRFKDGNKINFLLDNLELLCYNCYFLYASSGKEEDEILTKKQIKQIEGNQSITKPFDWDLNSDDLENIKMLGIKNQEEISNDDEYQFVTRKI